MTTFQANDGPGTDIQTIRMRYNRLPLTNPSAAFVLIVGVFGWMVFGLLLLDSIAV